MEDLETRKLSRAWTAVNWIGESSSLTGTDAIAFPGLGAENRNPNNRNWTVEKNDIETFYQQLSCLLENCNIAGKPRSQQNIRDAIALHYVYSLSVVTG